MKICLKFGCVATFFALATIYSGDVLAQSNNKTTFLVLAEDADQDSLPRDGSINKTILTELEGQLSQNGFSVYSESAITYEAGAIQPKTRLSETQLINIAKNGVSIGGAPINIRFATIFNSYAMVQDKDYTASVYLRIAGRVVDPLSGKFIGAYDIEDPAGAINIHPDCARAKDCLIAETRALAKELSMAMGYQLTKMVESYLAQGGGGDGTAPRLVQGASAEDEALVETYFLTFSNVRPDDMTNMEKYLVQVFSGYRNHDIAKSTGLTHDYTYWSTIEGTKLRRNLERAAEELGWKVNVMLSGNNFRVDKLNDKPRPKPAKNQ